MSGDELVGARYTHRFAPPEGFPILPSRYVTADTGTGLVHSAPAHGHEDYDAFISHGILPDQLRCPVDDAGLFTADVQEWSDRESASLVGKSVLGDGVEEMIRLLKADDTLLAEQVIRHRYPTDWKTKEPVIVRATPQWFADLSEIKTVAHQSLDRVGFYPPHCELPILRPTDRSSKATGSIHRRQIRVVHFQTEELGCSHPRAISRREANT